MHMAQLMPLPLTVSCYRKIQIGFTFLVPAQPGSPGQEAVKRARACVRVCIKQQGVTHGGGGGKEVRMIAAFLEIHHDVEQRHLRRTAACVQRFKVPRQYVLVVLPATHTAPRSASFLSRQRDTARVCY